MIERIRFKNFKALRDAELKLGPFNLIVGPNGSGKSTVLQAFQIIANPKWCTRREFLTVNANEREWAIDFRTSGMADDEWIRVFSSDPEPRITSVKGAHSVAMGSAEMTILSSLGSARVYALEPVRMSQATMAMENFKELERDGSNLGGALTYIHDQDEDAYDQLRSELRRWVPEFEGISFEKDQNNYRQLCLRQVGAKKKIRASEVSEGTLLALGLLAIAYQPNTPALIGVEEPDRALHPRLLREVRDALYRLAFPTDYGLKRQPVQVIATTHSPYFLDLFRDHPEQVIVAEKNRDGTATFRSLSDDPNLREIIGDAPLGEVWYSGVLGGVPVAK